MPDVIGARGTIFKGLVRRLMELDNSIVEVGENTEKSPGDLGSLAVTQTPMKVHQLV